MSINYANWPALETFNLYAIFNYAILLPERFSLYDTESMKGARRRKKQLAYFGQRTVLTRNYAPPFLLVRFSYKYGGGGLIIEYG